MIGLTILAPRALPGQETPTFADLAWGISRQAAKATLVAKGYTFVKEDEDHDLQFRTRVFEQPTVAYLMFNPRDELVKVYVVLATPDPQARTVYRQMVDLLTEKYGKPSLEVENYTTPYFAGDGYEDQAIQLGKLSLGTIWTPQPDASYGIVCRVTTQLAVSISYEPRAWEAEANRRSRAMARDF